MERSHPRAIAVKMTHQPELPPRAAVIEECRRRQKNIGGFPYNDHMWVKHGMYVTRSEAEIQRWVHKHADPDILRVPEVYDNFQSQIEDDGPLIGFILMERIHGKDWYHRHLEHQSNSDRHDSELHEHHVCSTPSKEEENKLFNALGKALEHLRTLPIPKDAKAGPFCGRSPIGGFFGPVFGDDTTFDTLEELENWINDTLEKIHTRDKRWKGEKAHPKRHVSLKEESMCIAHCDLNPSNVYLGEPITIIDWGWAGVYCKTFDDFGIYDLHFGPHSMYGAALYKHLFPHETDEHKERMIAMRRAAIYIDLGV